MDKAPVNSKRDATAQLSSSNTPTTSLFSKGFTFNRSPSRKGQSPTLAAPPYLQKPFARSAENELDKVTSNPSRPPSRPGYQRTFTVPFHSNGDRKLSLNTGAAASTTSTSPLAAADNMNSGAGGLGARKDSAPRSATAIHAPVDMSGVGLVAGLPTSVPVATGSQNPSILYQHIHDMATKRISTLDYLRKAHEGRVYWFNTIHFSKSDLSRLSSFQPAKLARRATNYMLLGISIPTILDAYTTNAQSPFEFLRALNTLLGEFESYQHLHPPDGSSSMSRARIPQMFKRSTHTSKGRRASSAASEIGLPFQPSFSDSSSMISGPHSTTTISEETTTSSLSQTTSTIPTSSSLDPTTGQPEEYTHLLTPSLPFDPDFYETFATLCDVLIDAYTRVMSLVSSPSVCSTALGEIFTKTDARLRKVIVGGVVREFEEASRAAAKGEVAGVGRVVLGGLMAQ